MTTETRGYTLAWIGVGLMLLGGVLYLWKLL
jgi:LPXTG-motif cell wall-anchored protein